LLACCDGGEGNTYCTACYTGNYPTQWIDVKEILPAVASPESPAEKPAKPDTQKSLAFQLLP
ncbi:MAG: hypothetical protein P4L10_05430, partial [Acidobacteriaceae bacterium]|nr:hypothetical protein [Acidobacteriaceae bacterium]